MNKTIVIIGGGISGMSIAWHLLIAGYKDVSVIDKSYFTSGATGRCGAGIRTQWATKMNCLLARDSMTFFETAKETLGYHQDLELKQKGYLILATTPDEVRQFEKNVKLQNSLGIPSVLLNPEEAQKIVPHVNPKSFLMASFCPKDGHLNPFKMTEAFFLAAKRLGAKVSFHETVTGIIIEENQCQSVVTTKRTIPADVIINAAGGYAAEVALMAGCEIPVYSENHQILATEPIEETQGPMVMSFSKNIYCQQVPHGSFLIGRGDPNEQPGHSVRSTWQFLDEMAKTVNELLPPLANLRVVRTWGGSYNMSPDRQPIISGTDVNGFYVAAGFSGHGFMFAPMTGKIMTKLINNEPEDDIMAYLSLKRFDQNEQMTIEHSVV